MLPRVVPCGEIVGELTEFFTEATLIPEGTAVVAAIGDNQASLLATLEDQAHDLALTLGTGGQLSAVLSRSQADALDWGACTCEQRPFPGGQRLAVAAILLGGAAWEWLADTVVKWCRDLGVAPPAREAVYRALNTLGLRVDSGPAIAPHFDGERHAPELRGVISDIDVRNFTLGGVARGLARGIIRSLRTMMPEVIRAGRTRVVGSGNALRRNELLREAALEVLGLPVVLAPEAEEAALGAARHARESVG
jgi:sedoheptulokinase